MRARSPSPTAAPSRQCGRCWRNASPITASSARSSALDRPDARFRWVLDPIDGTRAFITGRPMFGTLIALLDGRHADPRRHRPADHRRALDRRRRASDPVPRHAWAGGLPPVPRPARRRALLHLARTCSTPAQLARFERLQRRGAADELGRRLLRLRAAGTRRDRRDRRARAEALGLGRAGAGDRGRGRARADWRGEVLHPDGDGDVVAVGDPALMPQISSSRFPLPPGEG